MGKIVRQRRHIQVEATPSSNVSSRLFRWTRPDSTTSCIPKQEGLLYNQTVSQSLLTSPSPPPQKKK
jgi:hypothetical protein